MPQFSRIAKPLQNLLRENVTFDFDRRCHDAFNELKELLTAAPVLAIYNPKRITELHTDASALGFGAALMQKQDDGKFHPIAYFSKTTTAAESKYHSFELETLAIIYALRRFRVYLEGIPFKIITDCNSLTMTLGKKQLNPRIARWALELENYDYVTQHRVLMGHVDALSRCHEVRTQDEIAAAVELIRLNKLNETDEKPSRCQLVAAIDYEDMDLHLKATQSRDADIVNLRNRLETEEIAEFTMHNGLVFRKTKNDRRLLYVPAEMEENIIRLMHEKIGHQSVDKTSDQVRKHYWFPKMGRKIENFIHNCVKCIM